MAAEEVHILAVAGVVEEERKHCIVVDLVGAAGSREQRCHKCHPVSIEKRCRQNRAVDLQGSRTQLLQALEDWSMYFEVDGRFVVGWGIDLAGERLFEEVRV